MPKSKNMDAVDVLQKLQEKISWQQGTTIHPEQISDDPTESLDHDAGTANPTIHVQIMGSDERLAINFLSPDEQKSALVAIHELMQQKTWSGDDSIRIKCFLALADSVLESVDKLLPQLAPTEVPKHIQEFFKTPRLPQLLYQIADNSRRHRDGPVSHMHFHYIVRVVNDALSGQKTANASVQAIGATIPKWANAEFVPYLTMAIADAAINTVIAPAPDQLHPRAEALVVAIAAWFQQPAKVLFGQISNNAEGIYSTFINDWPNDVSQQSVLAERLTNFQTALKQMAARQGNGK